MADKKKVLTKEDFDALLLKMRAGLQRRLKVNNSGADITEIHGGGGVSVSVADNKAEIEYTLPAATSTTLGGVKVQKNYGALYIDNDDTLQLNLEGGQYEFRQSYIPGDSDLSIIFAHGIDDMITTYIPVETRDYWPTLMKPEERTKLAGLENYTLPAATSGALGGIRTGYTPSGANVAVAVDSNNKAYATIPTDTAVDSNSVKYPTSKAVAAYVANAVSGVKSFQGLISSSNDFSPTKITKAEAGWYWIVKTEGTYAGQKCEAGDQIYCIESFSTAQTDAGFISKFDVMQTNVDFLTPEEVNTMFDEMFNN